MRDEDEQRQNNYHHLPEDWMIEHLPSELETIHARLERESDGWARRLPEAEGLVSFAQALAAGTAAAPTLEPTVNAAEEHDPVESAARQPQIEIPWRSIRGQRRGRALLGLAAAVVIVALMAVVFSSLAPGRGAGDGKPTAAVPATSTPIPTATSRPAYGPVRGNWQAVPELDSRNTSVTLAPSDPSIVYETIYTQTTAAEPIGQYALLRRSSDGGKTWQTVAVPRPGDPSVTAWGPRGVLVSTADPNVVIMTVGAQLSTTSPATCPTDLTIAYTQTPGSDAMAADRSLAEKVPLDGFVRCSIQYVSRDSGSHWAKIQIAGIRSTIDGLDSLTAQDTRTYGTISAATQQDAFAGSYVVMSADSVNWQRIDTALLSQAKHICGFVAVPTGTTIYAKTNEDTCFSLAPHPDELWRSDDVGAHWRDLGPLGGQITMFGGAEQGQYDSQPTLYVYEANLPKQNQPGPLTVRLWASTDGGYTWQASPSAGMPAHYTPFMQLDGMLRDGSLVEIFSSNPQAGPHTPVTLAFYAWHAGDSEWHQVAPPISLASQLDLSDGSNLFFATPTGGIHGTLWHIQYSPSPPETATTVERYSL